MHLIGLAVSAISLLSRKYIWRTRTRVNFITPNKIRVDRNRWSVGQLKSPATLLIQCRCHKTIKGICLYSVDTAGCRFRYYAIPTVGMDLIAIGLTRAVCVKPRKKLNTCIYIKFCHKLPKIKHLQYNYTMFYKTFILF